MMRLIAARLELHTKSRCELLIVLFGEIINIYAPIYERIIHFQPLRLKMTDCSECDRSRVLSAILLALHQLCSCWSRTIEMKYIG